MTDNDRTKIAKEIAALEAKLEIFRNLRAALNHPQVVALLEDTAPQTAPAHKNGEAKQRGRPAKHYAAVAAFFKARNNEPATAAEILEGTKMVRGTLSYVLYHQRKDYFEKIQSNGSDHYKWRLKEDRLAMLK